MLMGMISCSPQKRLSRLIEKHPELIKHDTIYIKDTIITNHYHKDTVLSIHHHYGDTVIIKDHKLTTKIIYLPGDSIKVQGDCASDTIYKERPVYINSVNPVTETGNEWKWYFWILAGVIGLFALWKIFK